MGTLIFSCIAAITSGASEDAPVYDFGCFGECTRPIEPPYELLSILAFLLFMTVPILFAANWLFLQFRRDDADYGDTDTE